MKVHTTVVAALMGALAPSCTNDDKTTDPEPEPDPYLAPTSPANVLQNLQRAYEERELDRYMATLSSNAPEYTFMPSPADGDLGYHMLRYPEERAITERMFQDVAQIEIRLTYDANAPLGEPSDHLDYPASEGFRQIVVSDVYIRVVTSDGPPHDPLVYLVDSDSSLFIFQADSSVTPPTYTVAYQEDRHNLRLPVEVSSWGSLKATFLP